MNTPQDLLRKVNQHWEMAGLARQDRDKEDEVRHIAFARAYQQELAEMLREDKENRHHD